VAEKDLVSELKFLYVIGLLSGVSNFGILKAHLANGEAILE
jgi:hypothetical protein